jgi:hypothetical protein
MYVYLIPLSPFKNVIFDITNTSQNDLNTL